jgi:hypothetical protein
MLVVSEYAWFLEVLGSISVAAFFPICNEHHLATSNRQKKVSIYFSNQCNVVSDEVNP